MDKDYVKAMMTAIEQLIDERVSQQLKELQSKMEASEKASTLPTANEYLTIEQLSELTGLPKATIYAKRSRREIPAYKFGRELRFKREEIEIWMKTKQTYFVGERKKVA